MARICTRAERQAIHCLHACASSIPHGGDSVTLLDPKTVHDVRVGCRRMRVTLTEFRDQFAPGPRRDARETLRDVRKALGKLRELDVGIALLDQFNSVHPEAVSIGLKRLAALREDAVQSAGDLGTMLRGSQFTDSAARLEEAYRRTSDCYRKHAENRLKKRLKSLARQYETWTRTQRPDDLHDLRVRFKKLRYTLEVYVDLYGEEGVELLNELETAQDALGDWNDLRVLNEYLVLMDLGDDPSARAAVRRLTEAIERRMEECLKQFRPQAEDFFKKSRIRSAKKLFGNPKRPCCDKP